MLNSTCGEGNGNPLLAWGIPGTEEPGGLCGVAKSWTRLKQLSMQTQPESLNCRILIASQRVCVCVCVCVSRWVVSDSCCCTAHGVFRQEHWGGLPSSSSRGSPDPGMEPASSVSPALAGGFFIHWLSLFITGLIHKCLLFTIQENMR